MIFRIFIESKEMKVHKEYKPEELAEAYIFPDVVTGADRDEVLSVFREFRKEKSVHQSTENKYKNRLLQLRFLMEDYLKSSQVEEHYDFAYFLDQYITCLEMKYTDFAKDIDVGLSTISQIMGRHRKPSDKIIYRLYLHSNKNFPISLWYRVLEREKIQELESDKSILENEGKFIKHALDFSLFE